MPSAGAVAPALGAPRRSWPAVGKGPGWNRGGRAAGRCGLRQARLWGRRSAHTERMRPGRQAGPERGLVGLPARTHRGKGQDGAGWGQTLGASQGEAAPAPRVTRSVRVDLRTRRQPVEPRGK
ncbi:hypothetical protein P7K49_021060 [Saguinus oedipus]|uniref:Uncharacterized protein n=1 Tax=Saguinus oedipus TaxID=9490 RepID=A0ABQ9UTX2_SAGOE|nr:hypothetical protein P7K49_021060 [Saguinus oedipus]